MARDAVTRRPTPERRWLPRRHQSRSAIRVLVGAGFFGLAVMLGSVVARRAMLLGAFSRRL